MVYATAIAVHSCQGTQGPSDGPVAESHQEGSSARSRFLFHILQQSCRCWKFAEQVCYQLGPHNTLSNCEHEAECGRVGSLVAMEGQDM